MQYAQHSVLRNYRNQAEHANGRSNLSRAQIHQPSFENLVNSANTCVLCAHFLKTWVNCPSSRYAGKSDEENKQIIYRLERLTDKVYREPNKALRKFHREKDWFKTDTALYWPQTVHPGEWPPSGLENMLGSFTVRGAVAKGIDDLQGLYGLALQRVLIFRKRIWIDEKIYRSWTNLSCVTDHVSWIAGRPLKAHTAVTLGCKWLADCSKIHTSCGPLKDTEIPTRVIDVEQEGAQEPKLIETNGRYGQWVTLSYPWGGTPPITTRSTYDDNLKEMPMASLPQLFQDAVRVVREMGFQYLWIDSICIIQGDVEDWARECAHMAQFYELSGFTIAACAASSPRSSLTPSIGANNSSCSFEKEGIRFVASLDNMIDHEGPHMARERNSVIATRAWCLQERLLAPRVLYLGSKQPYWECHTCRFYEFLRTPLLPTEERPIVSKVGAHTISKSILGTNEPFKTKSWLDMVETYSRCILTNNMDKLPALSGIVQAAAKKTKDKYLAGIWLEELHKGLAWFCDPDQRKVGRAATEYRAPSWSWASIDEPVLFHWVDDYKAAKYEVLSATTTPATSDPFGRLSGGVLTLSAHIMEMQLTPSMRQPMERHYDENNKQFYLDFWPDRTDKNGKKARKLPCLLLGGTVIYGGLALEKVEGQSKTFRRVGFVYNSGYMYEWRIVGRLKARHLKKWLKRERQTVHLI